MRSSKVNGHGRGSKALIVGCDPDHLDPVAGELDAMGLDYELVASGAVAGDALLNGSFGLMLADAGLGVQDLRTLSSVGKMLNDDFRFVALVHRSARRAAENAFAARPDGLLRLPATARDVRDVLSSAVSSEAEKRSG